jgi:predicted ATPase
LLRQLRIENFKGWRDTQDIRMAPITVFFGVNSSGKTSILQFLLMLKQTAESPDRKRVLHLGDPYSTFVELGNFRDIAFRHDEERKINFSLLWDLPKKYDKSTLDDKNFSGEQMSFQASIRKDQRGSLEVERFSYQVFDPTMDKSFAIEMQQSKSSAKKYSLEATNLSLKRAVGRAWSLPSPVRFYGFPDEVALYYQNAGFVSDLAFQLELELRNIFYLGPLREDPLRIYTWSGEQPEHVGSRGDRAIEAILAAADRKIVPKYRSPSVSFPAMISRWLKRLGLLSTFNAKEIAKDRKEYEVNVRTQNSSTDVLLPDVGFGVSQVLPVVVECFYAPPNSTVVIEQPELHLHPKVQSELADLFIEAIHAREDNQDRNMQFIIESHSEHFLRRLQRRVAEGEIKPDQIALYYCMPGSDGSQIIELPLDLFGEIEYWPEEFFGDELQDLAARLKAASKHEAMEKANKAANGQG